MGRITDRWCEIGCKVQGEAARELYRVFYERWIEHTEMLAGLPKERAWIPKPEDVPVNSGGGKLLTQVSTTFGNPSRSSPFGVLGSRSQVVNAPHRLTVVPKMPLGIGVSTPSVRVGNDFFKEIDPAAPPLLAAAAKQTPTYAFAPTGRTGIYRQIEAAIAATRKYMYIEDQYLVDDMPMGALVSMLDLLKQRVKDSGFKKLIVLCTRLDEIKKEFLGQAGSHRRAFVEGLVEAGGDKVVICQYKSNSSLGIDVKPLENSPFYVHSKSWLFDDELLVVGSANCNRRGYSHDSELDFAVYDVEKAAIRELRTKIWLRRLNTETVTKPLGDCDVQDFLSAARYWERPNEFGLILENNRMGIDAFVPDSRPSQIVYETGGFGPAIDVLELAKGAVGGWLWDAVVDPDGT